MCLAPDTPTPQAPAPSAPNYEAVSGKRSEERKRQMRAKGNSSTILGGQNNSQANVGKTTLGQ